MSKQIKTTIVLVAGYARAGKDTLADGILSCCEPSDCKTLSIRIRFADPLKHAANAALDSLNIDGDFFDEEFKTRNRGILVALGEGARAIDKDVFANIACARIDSILEGNYPVSSVIITDWRYINEMDVLRKRLGDRFTIRTVYVETLNNIPANDAEALSIANIRRQHSCDKELYFPQHSKAEILRAGVDLAREWGL